MLKPFVILFRLILILLFLCVSVSFTIGNQESIAIAIPPLPYHFNIPTYLFGGIFFTFGLVAGIFTCIIHYNRKLRKIRRQLRQITAGKKATDSAIKADKTEHYARAQVQHRTAQHF